MLFPVLNDWFDNDFNDGFMNGVLRRANATAPAVNVKEDNEKYTMEVAVPGIKKEYVRVSLDADGGYSAPFDVKLNNSPLTIVQPDLMVICNPDKLDGKRCNGAPDFIIEIVSPGNPADDYIRKLYYYKNAGVREYWIVDPRRRTITVNFFEQNILNVQYSFEATIKVNIYDDLYIDFSEIDAMLN